MRVVLRTLPAPRKTSSLRRRGSSSPGPQSCTRCPSASPSCTRCPARIAARRRATAARRHAPDRAPCTRAARAARVPSNQRTDAQSPAANTSGALVRRLSSTRMPPRSSSSMPSPRASRCWGPRRSRSRRSRFRSAPDWFARPTRFHPRRSRALRTSCSRWTSTPCSAMRSLIHCDSRRSSAIGQNHSSRMKNWGRRPAATATSTASIPMRPPPMTAGCRAS